MSAVQREISYAPSEVVFPEWVDGVQHWISPEVQEITRKMHEGDPAMGWQGDPRLALYFDGPSQRWLVKRLEGDGEMRTFCRSAPGAPLNDGLILRLAEHDTRNGFDPVAFIASQEAAQDALVDEQAVRVAEIMDKVVHAIIKDNPDGYE